jgi:1,5-anhydro-D-fructose reductase (1,5-anhydro-D-mannitol-forming)
MDSDNNKLPLAICGLGRFASRRIIPAIKLCQNVELVAVVDPMDTFPLASNIQRFKSLEDLLDTHPTGAVYISTPNYLHARQTLQCLEAGLHVLCEKPMATNSFDCQAMVRVAQNLKLHLKIGHMLRYSPALKLARSWLQHGLVGKPRAIGAFFHYDLPEINRPWAFRQDAAGGGALLDAGTHCIDAMRFLVGDPVMLLGAITDPTQAGGVERSAVCRFTAAGVSCFVQVCSQAPYWSRLSVSGTDGVIVIDDFAACWDMVKVTLYARRPGHALRAVKEEIVDVSATYSEQIRDFADMVGRSEASSSAALDAAENVRIVEELYAMSHRF